MDNETGNRGLRPMRFNGSGGLFGISDMYRGSASSRMFRMFRTELLPTIPSGPEIDETYISQDTNTTFSSDDSIEPSFLRKNANIQTARTYGTDKSPGICQTDDRFVPTPKNVDSQYLSYASTNTHVCGSAKLQREETSEKYASITKPTITEMRNTRFLGHGNFTYREKSDTSVVERFSTNNEIRGTPTHLGNFDNPTSKEGYRFLQIDAREIFPGSGPSSVLQGKIDTELDGAGGVNKFFQTTGTFGGNEQSRVEISRIGSLNNSGVDEVHRGSLHVRRNEKDSGRVESKEQFLPKTELDRYSSSKTLQESRLIYPAINQGVYYETFNKILKGGNQEFSEEMNGNVGASRLHQTPAFSNMHSSRNIQEATWRHTPTNQSPNNRWFAPSGNVHAESGNVSCAGTCGGRPADYKGASCAPANTPRTTGFPKHARMFGASMHYKNKDLPEGIGNCGISLLPRVCRTGHSRHGCHRGYVHPIIRTIGDSTTNGIRSCRAKARGKKRSQTTATVDGFPYEFKGEEENCATCCPYENVELDSILPSPIPGAFSNSSEAGGISNDLSGNEFEPTLQKSQLSTRKRAKMKTKL